ncbi:hypothetical protein [Allokutzneria oryzae]|uniref:Uncharacterized protein n=1 Tax=Allokutzneria oryzae TaxID=1378989 RepID=A0ABV5ZX98_9PSEU
MTMAVSQGRAGTTWYPVQSDTYNLSLNSADELLCFQAEVIIEAQWVGAESPPPAMFSMAQAHVAHRADEMSRRRTLTQFERLQGELNAALFSWMPVPGAPVRARGHCVSIQPDEEMLAVVEARERENGRRAALSWQVEQRLRAEEHARSLILDPLRATASWFIDNQDSPEQAVVIAQHFQELRDILSPERQPESPGTLVDEVLTTADDVVRERLVFLLGNAFSSYGREDLRARLTSLLGG